MANNTFNVSDTSFDSDVIKSDVPVLVDFWAPWCGPCVAISPVLDELAQEYDGRVKIAKMNVDENTDVPASFGVRSIPYMVLFKEGKMVDSLVGSQPKPRLKDLLDKALA